MAVIKKNELIIPFLGSKLSFIRGLDPLGLQNVGDRIFAMLLPGLNSVTNRIRYYSFYCWLFDIYSEEEGSTNPKDQERFIRRAEYLLAIIAESKNQIGVPGLKRAGQKYSDDKKFIDIAGDADPVDYSYEDTFWKNPGGVFGQNYASSMSILKLIRDQGEHSGIYIRTNFEKEGLISGKQLADAFNYNVSNSARMIFLKTVRNGIITHDELMDIIDDFDMKNIPTDSMENNLLLHLLLAADNPLETQETFYRHNTIKLYLELLDENQSFVNVYDFVTKAYLDQGKIDEDFNDTFMAYYDYMLDQYWYILSTGIFSALLTSLRVKTDGAWIVENEFIEVLSKEIFNELIVLNTSENARNFHSLEFYEDDNIEISKRIIKGDTLSKYSYSFVLLRKIIKENSLQIDNLKKFAKEHDLRSASNFLAVYDEIVERSSIPLDQFIEYFLKKYVIHRHQFVSLRKMNNTQSTEKFIREDGFIRFISEIKFDFSGPRLGTLIGFLKDLGLLSVDSNTLSEYGHTIRKSLLLK